MKNLRKVLVLALALMVVFAFSAMAFAEFFWGPVSLKAGIGPNIVVSPQVTIPYYERLGVYYNFGNNYAGVAVNAHGGRVEFIEWTYGRRFPVW